MWTVDVGVSKGYSTIEGGASEEVSHGIDHKGEGDLDYGIFTHWIMRMEVIRFWKLELSPTYSNDFCMSMKVEGMWVTTNAGFLYCLPVISDWDYL